MRAASPLTIDGFAKETEWDRAPWYPIDQRWLGAPADAADFSGKYKVLWSDSLLYVLAEIVDDTLIDIHTDGLEKYWDDDCLEIFLDEDASGGNHQYSANAFAYHLSLDGRAVDINADTAFVYYDHHVEQARQTNGTTSLWEVAIRIYDENYRDDRTDNPRLRLKRLQDLGFMIAYCDNDHSEGRENFYGSEPIEGEDKNRGWIDASVLGLWKLL